MLEIGGAFGERLTQVEKQTGIAVLGGVFQKLSVRIDHGQGILTDVMQFLPEPVQFGGFGLIEHQSHQIFIFAVVDSQGDDFIDGDDFGVAQCGGKEFAKFVEGGFKAGSGAAAIVDDDGRVWPQAGGWWRRIHAGVDLDRSFGIFHGGGGDQLAVGDEFRWKHDGEGSGAFLAQISLVGKSGGIHAP